MQGISNLKSQGNTSFRKQRQSCITEGHSAVQKETEKMMKETHVIKEAANDWAQDLHLHIAAADKNTPITVKEPNVEWK